MPYIICEAYTIYTVVARAPWGALLRMHPARTNGRPGTARGGSRAGGRGGGDTAACDMPTLRILRHFATALGAVPSSSAAGRRMGGKTTIVTGAAHGIGKATATLFAREGAHVILADRDVLAGQTVAELIAAQSDQDQHIVFVECNVSEEDDVNDLIDVAQAVGGGKIDSLVNVAGVDIIAKLEDTEPDRWDRVMTVNLRSVFLTCKSALPYLTAAGRASIVNVSSIQASRGFSGYVVSAVAL